MPHNCVRHRNRTNPLRLRSGSHRLVVCSVCLRVHDGGVWIDTHEAIRRLRTFERDDVVRLAGALCERCEWELRLRRQRGTEELAA
jgi:hypothetical protein